jgi:flagellar assembly factor FliW
VIINTTRFGKVEIAENDLIRFDEGILGFADLHEFVILDDPSDDIFAWLQSCNDPAIAFPVLEPELIMNQYAITLAKSDLEALKMQNMNQSCQFSIITIPDDPSQMTANMKAPVVINKELRIAKQCVLQDNHLAIREPIFTRLQTRVANHPTLSIKQQSAGSMDVAVKITGSPKEIEL